MIGGTIKYVSGHSHLFDTYQHRLQRADTYRAARRCAVRAAVHKPDRLIVVRLQSYCVGCVSVYRECPQISSPG